MRANFKRKGINFFREIQKNRRTKFNASINTFLKEIKINFSINFDELF
jgi:hypothetical protein